MATTAPYGAWASPISAELVAAGGVSLDEVRVGGDHVHWIEGRPLEGGRQVVCRARPGRGGPGDLIPEGFNARTRVHEYGGGAYTLAGDTLFFSDFTDQRLYRLDPGAEGPRPITPEPPAPAAHRYADACPTPDGRRLVCVRERHQGGEIHNELVVLPADGAGVGGQPVVLAAGRDFYASPRVSPDGRRLAWLEWDHPNMPWDGTELKLADLAGDGLAGDPVTVAGGPEESVFQPSWSPDGVLHLVSDRTGWWNLYRAGPGGLEPLYPAEEEFGHPQWVFAMSTYAFLPGGRIACIHGRGPLQRLGFLGPAGERPPLVVASHGGPTAGIVSDLHVGFQFFTSRGIAVVDVDYGGSTGYGRAYRMRLDGRWGIVDVQDCVAAARHLAERGDVDPARLAIRGGSAGGYTTLCALTFTDEFAAGASYYGVADAAALAKDTHKFESRYLDRLIGPWPEAEALYRERSPNHFTDRLSCPVILLQGLEDKVVPPSQAEMMAAALDAKAIPYAYLPFEGEQHGFRQAAHIRRACEAEVYFYSRVFGFDLADPVDPVPIAHLDPEA